MELLEIEKELSGPDAQQALEKYDGRLLALEARMKQAMAEGLPPDEYAKCKSLEESIVIARKLIRLQVRGNQEV